MPSTYAHCTRLAVLATGLAAVPLPASQDAEQADISKRITELATRTIEAEGSEGLAFLLDVGGDSLFSGAWGTTHAFVDPQPVTPESAWPAAALIEPFTAVVMMQLAAEDKLELSDPVGKHLDGMEWEGHEVTLDHLLGHTSGITAYDRLSVDDSDESRDPVARLAGEGLEFTPGSCLSYSNSNQLLLGRIIEKIDGAPLADVIAKRIFSRLAMESSGFEEGLAEHLGVNSVRHMIAGSSEDDDNGAARFGAGNLAVSANDLMRFVRGLTGRDVVEEAGFARMTSDRRLSDGTLVSYGYGLNDAPLGDIAGVSFGGAIEDNHVFAAWYPELDLAVVAVADGAGPDLEAFARHAARIAFGLRGPEIEDFPLTEEELGIYTGTYQIACDQVTVRVEDGHLAFSGVQQPTLSLQYQGRDMFVAAEDPDVRLYFAVEDDKAYGFVLEQRGTRSNARRVD